MKTKAWEGVFDTDFPKPSFGTSGPILKKYILIVPSLVCQINLSQLLLNTKYLLIKHPVDDLENQYQVLVSRLKKYLAQVCLPVTLVRYSIQ